MNKSYILVAMTVMLSGCMGKAVKYNNQWSKAKNLTSTAGMSGQTPDQQLPSSAYSKEGLLLDYKLNAIEHPASGSRDTSIYEKMGHSAFNNIYWGWSVPGAGHRKSHRLFAWLPKHKAQTEADAKAVLESIIEKTATDILKEMGYKLQPVKTPYTYLGITFQQWQLERESVNCTFEQMNCMLSIYIPEPVGPVISPAFSFYATAAQSAWLFHIADESRYPRVALSQGKGIKSMDENVFYQKLSARLPGWAYLYLGPEAVSIAENNRTIDYPYVLEKGKPLLFVRPVK